MADIRSFKELRVWQNAMDAAVIVFDLTKRFPVEERYSLTDQFRRWSRSVAANISEAWRKRRYPAAFVSKLNDAEGEAAQVSDMGGTIRAQNSTDDAPNICRRHPNAPF